MFKKLLLLLSLFVLVGCSNNPSNSTSSGSDTGNSNTSSNTSDTGSSDSSDSSSSTPEYKDEIININPSNFNKFDYLTLDGVVENTQYPEEFTFNELAKMSSNQINGLKEMRIEVYSTYENLKVYDNVAGTGTPLVAKKEVVGKNANYTYTFNGGNEFLIHNAVSDHRTHVFSIEITYSGEIGEPSNDPVSSVTIKNEVSRLKIGKTLQLNAEVLPKSANQQVIWSSSKPEIAEISSSGLVNAKAIGNTTISVKSKTDETKNDSFNLEVHNDVVLPTRISLPETYSLRLNSSATLKVNVTPSDATLEGLIWSSSNSAVCSVNNGVITGHKVGDATISAKINNLEAKTKVTVSESSTTILPNVDVNQYYNSLEGLTGVTLKNELHSLMHDGINFTSYDDLKYDFLKTDTMEDENGTLKMVDFYTHDLMSISNPPSWTIYNREHVWPKSLGVNGTEAYGDIQHIRPDYMDLNSWRGNCLFGVVSGGGTKQGCKKDGNTFEPNDVSKGDVARIVVYVAVTHNLSLSRVMAGSNEEIKNTLKTWNDFDPVDDIEMKRNNEAYLIQKNRNAFIDVNQYFDLVVDALL
ncbi:MAG: endonuclease [Bacilli bacterium]|nr:endonuclease [Bacilli bacterium]